MALPARSADAGQARWTAARSPRCAVLGSSHPHSAPPRDASCGFQPRALDRGQPTTPIRAEWPRLVWCARACHLSAPLARRCDGQSVADGGRLPFRHLARETQIPLHRQRSLIQRIVVALVRRQRLLKQLLHEGAAPTAGYAALEAPHQIIRQTEQKLFGGYGGASITRVKTIDIDSEISGYRQEFPSRPMAPSTTACRITALAVRSGANPGMEAHSSAPRTEGRGRNTHTPSRNKALHGTTSL